MTLPVPYQSVLDAFSQRGIVPLEEPQWTTSLNRHVGVKMSHCGDFPCYAKLALAKHGDLDEPDMLDGMRREVWWSQVIGRLRQENSSFPFTSPRILETNINKQPFQDEVAWVIMEYIDGVPIVDWEPERIERHMTSTENERFDRLFDAVIKSLLVLEQIHPQTLDDLGLSPLPAPPHGMRRWQKKGVLDMETAVLGNGAFEIKNFWRTPDGQLVIMDNEFAGWYPQYDHLSYLYHRLYCNTMRPDLAKRLLKQYKNQCRWTTGENLIGGSGFAQKFSRLLKPRLLGGWYYDMVRRKLPPWHKKQRLRYGLYWSLLRGKYGKLVN